ncbi:hypothetical protein [Halorussus sp. MSC15.2]|uniref:hypothetical protein n=1 Tax=Halorussus sp. MSC15.2 TaxID=2283638 RepID=UPI0013D468C8|nr:hypothetical protein [Halorussus sp. MSC15.2]NEU56760.1 hypothetical protein [Halorussus sp. MSC15.2]
MSADVPTQTASVSLDDADPQQSAHMAHDYTKSGRLAPVPDEDAEHEVLLKDYDELDYPDPIEHGHGIQAVLEDLLDEDEDDSESFYTRLFEGWQNLDIEPEEEPVVLAEDVHDQFDWLHDDYPAHLVLSSKGWMVGRDVDDDLAGPNAGAEALISQYYEYNLSVMRYDEDSGKLAADLDGNLRAPVSYQCWVQPQDENLVRPSGDPMVCQHGEGSRFKTQTTYAGSKESLVRTVQITNLAATALGVERPDWSTFNRDSWKVWKGEVHHRFASEMMDAVVQRLREAKSMLEYGGRGDVDGDSTMREGMFVEEMVRSDRWNVLGFNAFAQREGIELGLKVYRINGSPRDDRLSEPKLEAFFAGTDHDTELPHADEWAALRATLRQMASTVAVRSGLNLGLLREDDYYEPRDRERIDTLVPTGWRAAVQEANETRLRRILNTVYGQSGTQSKWDLLYAVATMNGTRYEELAEITGFTEDYVQEMVGEFVEDDVLLRLSMPTLVVFNNEELRLNALDELEAIHPDEDLKDIRERGEQRREDRQQARENRTSDADATDNTDASTGDSSSAEDDDDGRDDAANWETFADVHLTGEQLGAALDRDHIDGDHVEIRTDPYPAIFTGG